MNEPWEESGDGSSVAISFEGFDAAKRDSEEAREFLNQVSREANVTLWFGGRWVPTSPTMLALVVLGGALAYGAVRLAASGLFGADVSLSSYGYIALFAFLAPFVAGGLVAKLLPKRPAIETRPFTIRLASTGLSVTGAESGPRTLPLAEIERFEGGTRLAIVKSDGTREELAGSLVAAHRHAELAGRLNEALRVVRAATADYRGVRVAESAAPADDREEAEQEEERARLRRE